MPRSRLCRIRPKEQEQLVPTAAAFSRRGEHGEQRQSAPMMSVMAEEGVVVRAKQRGRTERRQTKAGDWLSVQRVRHDANVARGQGDGKQIPNSETTLTQV